jgi:pyrrolysine biosynthesis protein PylC
MDVEVVLHRGELKVLEIDARLPSQTPTAVLGSTGQNMVQILNELFINNLIETGDCNCRPAGAVYEHIRVCQDIMEFSGEHIMTGGGPLHLRQDFFGADEAITNFKSDKDQWIATLIILGEDRRSALAKRDRVIERILKRCSIKKVYDSLPAC